MKVTILNPNTAVTTSFNATVEEPIDYSVGIMSNQGYTVVDFIDGEVDVYMFLQAFSKALTKMYEQEQTLEDELNNHYLQDCLDTFIDDFSYYPLEPEYDDDFQANRTDEIDIAGYEDLCGDLL